MIQIMSDITNIFRLSHSYIRRENWILSGAEDWRFTDMKHKYPQQWWWLSFVSTYTYCIYIFKYIFIYFNRTMYSMIINYCNITY
jgi:hypothetical protein